MWICSVLMFAGPSGTTNGASLEDSLSEGASLLEGVADFLREDVAGQLDSHRNFLARVAANSVRIAQRELRHGAALADAEQRRLRQLLATDGSLDQLRVTLSQQLREGLPLATPGLAAHLRQTVAGQLAIDQPSYSALSRST